MSELEAPPPAERGPTEGVTAAITLAGLPLAGRSAQTLDRTRLSPMVAASLRSALDALLGDATTRRPLRVASDDTVLDLLCPSIDPAGLRPAGAMLEMIDGQLGATLERGTWSVRVPTLAGRASYLMIEQGTLKLAVPWHSVARVRVVPNEMIESMARRQGYAVLSPIARAGAPPAERPAILVGHGLRRAWLVADRLVWRMPADKVLAPETAGRELGHGVQTDDGEVFWVVDPARLLRDVELPPLPDPSPPMPAPPPAALEPEPAAVLARVIELRRPEVEPLDEEAASNPASVVEAGPPVADDVTVNQAAVEREVVPEVAPDVALVEGLEPSSVEPLDEVSILEEAIATPVAASGATSSAAIPPASPVTDRRRALVAEDSITARIFLARLLEQEGFEVHEVATAAELHALLSRGPWSVAFVDVELPDAHGLAHLEAGGTGRSFPVVALVRDRADEEVAEQAGVRALLPKPFERDVLRRVLDGLGLEAGS